MLRRLYDWIVPPLCIRAYLTRGDMTTIVMGRREGWEGPDGPYVIEPPTLAEWDAPPRAWWVRRTC
jgi:hypothetical protein